MILQKLILFYLRKVPLDYGKQIIAKLVKLPAQTNFQYTNQHGICFQLDLNEYQMRQIFLFDLYERNTIRHLLKLIRRTKPSFTFVDVGANIGFYSMTVAKIFGTKLGAAHAFEPNPMTFHLLEKNLKENNLSAIHLNMLGLSSNNSTATLTSHAHNLGAANIYLSDNSTEKTSIQLQKFDDYCKRFDIKSVDVIKVDIEGAELDFLKGAEAIIRNSKKVVLLMEIVDENCRRAGYTANEIFEYCLVRGVQGLFAEAMSIGFKTDRKNPTTVS